MRLRLFVAGQHIVSAFPGGEIVEGAEFLSETHRLIDDALALFVVTHLDKSAGRKILAQRMAGKAVVGENATQVRMPREENTEQVVGLALEPVGTGEDAGDRRHRHRVVGRELHPHADVLRRAEQMVHHLEALLALRVVDTADIDDRHKAGLITQHGDNLHDRLACHRQRQLAKGKARRKDCITSSGLGFVGKGVEFFRNIHLGLPLDRAGAANLLLQHQQAVEQRLGRRRAAWHIDVHRDHAIAAAHHRIGIVVVAAAIGARAHRHNITRLGHLVVDLAQRRGHLVGQRTRNDHYVRLARRGARCQTKALDVIARHGHLDHFDGAARQTERHPHQRTGAGPVDQLVRRGDQKALVGQFVVDLGKERIIGADRLASRRIEGSNRTRRDQRAALWGQSHSSAPFFHS